MLARHWIFSLLVPAVFCHLCSAAQSALEIVSIVDHPSATACLIKVFSVVATSKTKRNLRFRFILFESSGFGIKEWNSTIMTIFPDVSSDIKVWTRPETFPTLSGKGFEQSSVFARFYIPTIFSDLKRFIFLDNDLVVTTDLSHLHYHQLSITKEIPKTSDLFIVKPVVNSRTLGRTVQLSSKHVPRQLLPKQDVATVGFVYERHPGYKDFLRAHFNLTNPRVVEAIDSHGGDAFLNAGVFVVDAQRWRLKNYTTQMEHLMALNRGHRLFNAEAVGDQGPFLLLFTQDTAYLSPRYNLRRQPKKTIQLLGGGITGTFSHSHSLASTARRNVPNLLRLEPCVSSSAAASSRCPTPLVYDS
jgi:lipopolysaccharide biosynthesis glycosyltransferase